MLNFLRRKHSTLPLRCSLSIAERMASIRAVPWNAQFSHVKADTTIFSGRPGSGRSLRLIWTPSPSSCHLVFTGSWQLRSHNRSCSRLWRCLPASALANGVLSAEVAGFSDAAKARLVTVVGGGSLSPWEDVSWKEVMEHMARRLACLDSGFNMLVIEDDSLLEGSDEVREAVTKADILVAANLDNVQSARWIAREAQGVATLVAFQSHPELESRLGGVKVSNPGFLGSLRAALPLTKKKEAVNKMRIIKEAWDRLGSDNILFVLLLLIDTYVTPVKSLQNLRATSLQSVQCMIKNCGPQVLACMLDPECRKALDCLQKCAPTDQVCSYRCIVSYESPLLEAFTLCILQKHNCLGLSAEIQMQPEVQPMTIFRGEALTHSLAEDLFVGWLQELGWSWRVVAGQNAAYDQFPCQYQIFYRGRGKGAMWYDPVFQVKTLEGKTVWRRRHYRVKRGDTPGTFFFSVLDNGVVSKEFWRIVDVTDDLAWGLFYYSGAAAAAGQSYTGAVLVTPDGKWPDESQLGRLNIALERCGIKGWELFKVDNSGCKGAPIGLPEGTPVQNNLLALGSGWQRDQSY